MKELLDGDFVKADGTIVPYDDISDNTLGILFSAQWVYSSNDICNINWIHVLFHIFTLIHLSYLLHIVVQCFMC